MLRLDHVRSAGFSPKRIGRFIVVGGIASVLYFTIGWLLFRNAGMSETVAANLAFIVVVGWNYLMHYHWTFGSDRPHLATISRFSVMSGFGFALNWLVIGIGTRGFSKHFMMVQLVAAGLVVLSNLIISTVWVFGVSARAQRSVTMPRYQAPTER